MNKHSKAYEEKKTELERIEKDLREVLDQESKDVEDSVLRVLKIAAIASTAILVGYGVYKWTTRGEKSEEEIKPAKKENGFFDKVVDKVTEVVTGLAVQNISNYLDKLKGDLTIKR